MAFLLFCWPEWQFYNCTALSGIFVNRSGRIDVTTRFLGLLVWQLHFIFSILHFHVLKLWWVTIEMPSFVFHILALFLLFLCTFYSTQCGFYVLNSFASLGISFCELYWLGTTPMYGVFSFYIIVTIFVPLKL